MSTNISGLGVAVQIFATYTFPIGFNVTEFADDADPIDIPSIQIGDVAMGLNGNLVTWTKASPLLVNLSVIPTSQSDINLAILFNSNRAAGGKISFPDTIIMTVGYPKSDVNPDGFFATFTGGKILSGPPADAISSSARMKSKTYNFAFEDVVFS